MMFRVFQSTLPARGATEEALTNVILRHFNPRSPHGERLRISAHTVSRKLFQSTLPARGATRHAAGADGSHSGNFNPRSPHGERQRGHVHRWSAGHYFNPRSPHGERLEGGWRMDEIDRFQSTLPARGATSRRPQGWRQSKPISIHAPRTGSDPLAWQQFLGYQLFQSTLPARGATRVSPSSLRRAYFNPRSPHGERPQARFSSRPARSMISIHAPRTGSDVAQRQIEQRDKHFNPRSPHGERRLTTSSSCEPMNFNPRSPHGERPDFIAFSQQRKVHFNPRSPHGERPAVRRCDSRFLYLISIHAPRTGSDVAALPDSIFGLKISIHAPRTGSDQEPQP